MSTLRDVIYHATPVGWAEHGAHRAVVDELPARGVSRRRHARQRRATVRGTSMGIFGKDEPEVVDVRGRPLRCLVCDHDTFYQRRAQLHSGIATFFQLEWTSPTCVCVVCSACGHVHWFLP